MRNGTMRSRLVFSLLGYKYLCSNLAAMLGRGEYSFTSCNYLVCGPRERLFKHCLGEEAFDLDDG